MYASTQWGNGIIGKDKRLYNTNDIIAVDTGSGLNRVYMY